MPATSPGCMGEQLTYVNDQLWTHGRAASNACDQLSYACAGMQYVCLAMHEA